MAVRSVRQLAQIAGVSPATVSRVFSDSDTVAESTRQRIMQLADVYGFRPSPVSRAVFGGRTDSVGVVLPQLRGSFYAQLALGLQEELLEEDILPVILQSTEGGDRRSIRRLIDHRVDAMILNLIDESLNRDDFLDVLKVGLPIVLLGYWAAGLDADAVASDDVQGGRQVGEHLIQLGHRRIATTYFGQEHSDVERRLTGFRNACQAAGLAMPPGYLAWSNPHLKSDERQRSFRKQLAEIFTRPDRPTAVFAATDYHALEVLATAQDCGLRVPQDLSVVGYADLDFTAYCHPSLTTVRQDALQMGRQAGKLALQRLDGRKDSPRQVRVPTELIVRHSTAPPPLALRPDG